ncbi:hypothetical protein RND71_029194 [Anisodus tanguticus]|uniref:F-box/LRR-repeat protein 15/At3g58940/PEG3-like LRR domain-containing protein n=1 Tax=Anisodus tanguticus TaxID=243964 RepID=A0AAE1REY9_9SOLA|nr:hypothetical protein RND71_029194 [Anisodus tanguticus]
MLKHALEEFPGDVPVIEKYVLVVANALATRVEPLPSIQKFRMCVTRVTMILSSLLDDWIGVAIEKNVKELELHVDLDHKDRPYLLPYELFASKSITSLKLNGCGIHECGVDYNDDDVEDGIVGDIMDDDDIKLQNLRELSMKAMRINENVVHHFVQGCPFIEGMRLIKFVQGFDAKGFNLFLASKQDVNIYEDLKELHLLHSGAYKIELTKSARTLENLLNSHLRDFQPKTLTLKTSPTSDLLVSSYRRRY